jgi:hypothetical protein
MSYARGFGLNGKSFYGNVAKPCYVALNFVVDSTNGNGLGIRSLKSNGYVNNVFMHTSATPGVSNGHTNPNPAVGFALIQMKQNFNYFLGMTAGFVTPVATSTKIDNSALTVGQVYVITTLGDASLSVWRAIGVPAGVTPAVGVAFVALTVGAGANTSTSRVMLPTTSGNSSIEIVGNTNLGITSDISSNDGQYIMVQFSAPTSSSVTTLIPTAPANNSVCGMALWFDGSSVTIDGI